MQPCLAVCYYDVLNMLTVLTYLYKHKYVTKLYDFVILRGLQMLQLHLKLVVVEMKRKDTLHNVVSVLSIYDPFCLVAML